MTGDWLAFPLSYSLKLPSVYRRLPTFFGIYASDGDLKKKKKEKKNNNTALNAGFDALIEQWKEKKEEIKKRKQYRLDWFWA